MVEIDQEVIDASAWSTFLERGRLGDPSAPPRPGRFRVRPPSPCSPMISDRRDSTDVYEWMRAWSERLFTEVLEPPAGHSLRRESWSRRADNTSSAYSLQSILGKRSRRCSSGRRLPCPRAFFGGLLRVLLGQPGAEPRSAFRERRREGIPLRCPGPETYARWRSPAALLAPASGSSGGFPCTLA